jgi:two-component system response regulator YesN
VGEVKNSFNEAGRALKHKVFFGKNTVIRIEDIEVKPSDWQEQRADLLPAIIKQLKAQEIEACIREMEKMLQHMNKSMDSEELTLFFMKLTNSIEFTLNEMGVDIEDIYVKGTHLFDEYLKCDDMTAIREWIYGVLRQIGEFLESRKHQTGSDAVQKVKLYVQAHYAEEVTINEIASSVFMNAAYLGRVFKKSEGISFNEFVNTVRMDKAKELLVNTPMKIADIAKAVGIASSQHFIYCFKSVHGTTPKKYRESILFDKMD